MRTKIFYPYQWIFFIAMTLLAIYIMSSIVSGAEVQKSDLRTLESVIVDVDIRGTGGSKFGKRWVTFSTVDGGRFYYRPTKNKVKNTNDAVELLEPYIGRKVTIFYTEQREWAIGSLISFSGYERTVAIEFGEVSIFDIEDFNQNNKANRMSFVVASAIIFAFGLFIFLFPAIPKLVYRREERKMERKRQEMKKLKKMKKEMIREKLNSTKTDDDSSRHKYTGDG